jgi:hypothetical protein
MSAKRQPHASHISATCQLVSSFQAKNQPNAGKMSKNFNMADMSATW